MASRNLDGLKEGRIHILLVEDESAHAELVQRAFEDHDNRIALEVANSLAAARAYLSRLPFPPDLIIADWRLPDGDGLDLLSASPNLDSPVIIMTSHGNERIAVDAMKAGALDYVVKSEATLVDMPHIAERAIFEWDMLHEQERIQTALDKTEERLHTVVANVPIVLFALDRQGAFTFAEGKGLGRFTLGADRVVGATVFEMYRSHPDILINFYRALAGEEYQAILNIGGTIFETWFSALKESSKSGNASGSDGIIGVASDITARWKAEEDLRASEDRFRSLVQNAYDVITVINREGLITYETPSVARILGYEPGSMIGKSALDFIHPQDQPAIRLTIQEVMLSGQPGLPAELRFCHAAGDWVYLEVLATSLLDQPGIRGVVLTSRDITERKRAELELQQAHADLADAYDATIEGWSRALDLRDKETEGHTRRVTEMTLKLWQAMNLPADDLVHLRRGALLHDIGKMGISDLLLQKPGPLDETEWVDMRKHPLYAYEMLYPIVHLRPALDIPYCHHEWWDGTGYPRRLKGEEIPLAARVFAIVDVWDALSSDRPYRRALPQAEVLAHLQEGSGRHFDPSLVPLFINMLREMGNS
jgi:PAS domain S-box-containing protein